MAILDWMIRRTVQQTIDDTVEGHLQSDGFREMVLRELRAAMPHFDFVKQIQERLQEASPSLSDKDAYDHAAALFEDFCRDEKCQFGDPRFDWTRAGAREIAEEDIAHWEPA